MKYKYIILLEVIIAAVILYLYFRESSRSREHFNPNEVEATEQDGKCRIYYTNSIKACKDGTLDPSIEYYKNRLKKLTSKIRGGRVPTPQERSDIARYTRLIADYKEIRSKTGNTECSLSLPGWTTNPDGPFLGNISRNTDRGDSPNWAYCYKKDVSAQMKQVLEGAGFVVDTIPEDPTMTRIAFSNGFPYEQTKAAYCAETEATTEEYKLGTGFFIKNVLSKDKEPVIQFFRDGVAKKITLEDIYAIFDNKFFEQRPRINGNYEHLDIAPLPTIPCRVKRVRTNACGKKVLVSSGQGEIRFKTPVIIKTVPKSAEYLRGTIPQLKTRRLDKNGQLNYHSDVAAARIRDMTHAQNVIRDRYNRIWYNNWIIGIRRNNINWYNRFTYTICRARWERC